MTRSNAHLFETTNPVLGLLHKATKREDYYPRNLQETWITKNIAASQSGFDGLCQCFECRFGSLLASNLPSLQCSTSVKLIHSFANDSPHLCLPIGTLFLHNALTRKFSSIAKLWWRRWTYAKPDWWSDNSRDAKELTTHHSVLIERPRYTDVPGFRRHLWKGRSSASGWLILT